VSNAQVSEYLVVEARATNTGENSCFSLEKTARNGGFQFIDNSRLPTDKVAPFLDSRDVDSAFPPAATVIQNGQAILSAYTMLFWEPAKRQTSDVLPGSRTVLNRLL
jgi:hypothetical protein